MFGITFNTLANKQYVLASRMIYLTDVIVPIPTNTLETITINVFTQKECHALRA